MHGSQSDSDSIQVASKPQMAKTAGDAITNMEGSPPNDLTHRQSNNSVAAAIECSTPESTDGPTNENSNKDFDDQTNLLPMKQLLIVFSGLSAAMFCSMLNQTIVSTILPVRGSVFNDASISSWVGTAYMLTSTATQPFYGRFTDIFGRKGALLGSLAIFLIGSIISGVSQSMIMLVIARAIAGIVVSDVVSLKERGKYQGITGVVVAIGNALGPVVGD